VVLEISSVKENRKILDLWRPFQSLKKLGVSKCKRREILVIERCINPSYEEMLVRKCIKMEGILKPESPKIWHLLQHLNNQESIIIIQFFGVFAFFAMEHLEKDPEMLGVSKQRR